MSKLKRGDRLDPDDLGSYVNVTAQDAIRIPDEENAWQGAFKCHHGSCAERGWRDLTDWLAAAQEDVLGMINANAPDTWRGL